MSWFYTFIGLCNFTQHLKTNQDLGNVIQISYIQRHLCTHRHISTVEITMRKSCATTWVYFTLNRIGQLDCNKNICTLWNQQMGAFPTQVSSSQHFNLFRSQTEAIGEKKEIKNKNRRGERGAGIPKMVSNISKCP